MTTEKEQLEAEIAERDARIAGAERCAECGTITARLDGDGCAKWCCHCGARLNGDYVNVAALKAQPSAGAADLRQVATDALMGMIAAITGTTPPADQPPPPFIQSAIDRAVDRIARLNPCRAKAVPDGYAVVPVEPTIEMIAALGFDGDVDLAIGHAAISAQCVETYRKLLAAAQQKESGNE